MKLNQVKTTGFFQEKKSSTLLDLRRAVMSCFLWEDQFYENGMQIAERISLLVNDKNIRVQDIVSLAIEVRTEGSLRHVPLLITACLVKRCSGSNTISLLLPKVIQRADEMAEFLCIYAKVNNTTPDKLKPFLSNQVRKGISKAFNKFNAYTLAKYNRKGSVTLKDVIRLCHVKPVNEEMSTIISQILKDELASPDTWEVALSSGKDKKETFTRLLQEKKLGALALLRNLRNMVDSGVSTTLVTQSILSMDIKNILPFRFITASRYAPTYYEVLNKKFLASVDNMQPLKGKTVVLVDVSGSMENPLSKKSDLTRLDAACALGAIVKSDEVYCYSFSHTIAFVPSRTGLDGIKNIANSQRHNSTELKEAILHVNKVHPDYDRLIVITDEQSQTGASNVLPNKKGYIINVASYQNGIDYNAHGFVSISGFSENVLKFIKELEDFL